MPQHRRFCNRQLRSNSTSPLPLFPIISIFGWATFSAQAVLIACGVLAAVTTAERLGRFVQVPPGKMHAAAILGIVSLFIGERIVLFAQAWRTFLAHPLWMLGLVSVKDSRLFYAGVAVSLIAMLVYLGVSRVRPARAATGLLPAVLLLLSFVHAGYFAEGAEPGRVTTKAWGLAAHNRAAHLLYGMPLDVPVLPIAAWLAGGYALLALLGVVAATRRWRAGGLLLLAAGALGVAGNQLQRPGTAGPLFLGAFPWPFAAASGTVLVGCLIAWRQSR